MSYLQLRKGYQSTLKGLGSYLVTGVIRVLREAYTVEKIEGNETNKTIFRNLIDKVEKEKMLDGKDVEIISFELRARGGTGEEVQLVEDFLHNNAKSNHASLTAANLFSELGS